MVKPQELRPFHEVIVDVIHLADKSQMEFLAMLIKMTKIPKNHDNIVVLWNEKVKTLGCWGGDDLGVPANLLSQKEASEKKSDEEKKGVNLDDLQQETEKLLSLLKDRQPGLMGWNDFMMERMKNMNKLTSQGLK